MVPEAKIETSQSNQKSDPIVLNPKKTFSMGVVELTVKNLETVAAFYRDTVGFDTVTQSGKTIDL
jgi:catechol-2,3-dioxygenase